MRRALHEIRENGLSICEASKRFGVPRTTIQDRIHGRIDDIARKTGPKPLLTNKGEKNIVDWIKNIAKCGFPLKKSDLIQTVKKILKDSKKESLFKGRKPGQKWYYNFFKRHPDITLREAESINKARAVITEENIRLWFADL
ncbi:hypothetical protein NQ314_021036 [Rhamnusium bicolor]|uniref:HTH CENPB-type domain-containing protein n=1 Tax=Rhamnusium bicolor TaxID=1586634 RepID=A0AAV8WJL6_9CUCU|nr:hypothetical protein NQ314_021036 [Rhamnusium bicolor]